MGCSSGKPMEPPKSDEELFHAAVNTGNVSALRKELLKKKVDINCADAASGNAALTNAVVHGFVEIVKILIDNGANVNVQDKAGRSPLIVAIFAANSVLATHLILNGADVNIKTEIGITPLMMACAHGHLNIIDLLLNKGSVLETQDKNGWTALMHASATSTDATILHILEKGANIDAVGHNGENCLMIAAQKANQHTARVLIQNHVNLDAKDKHGHTAKEYADLDKHNVVKILLEKASKVIESAESSQKARKLSNA